MTKKNNSLIIFLAIGAVILFSSFKNKNKTSTTKSIIDMNAIPVGTNSIYLIPQAVVYDAMLNPIYVNNSNSYLQVAVLNDPNTPVGMFNIAYGNMNFDNALPGFVNFQDTIVNP